MKKPSSERRAYSILVTRKRTARRYRSPRGARRDYGVLAAPEVFGVSKADTRRSLLPFLQRLRNAVLAGKRKVLIDFRETVLMTPAGTLLFAAELNRIIRITTGAADASNGDSVAGVTQTIKQPAMTRMITCTYPKNKVVAQVLQQVGIFEMLGQLRRCRITAANVMYWRFHTGDDVDGKAATHAISDYRELFTDPETQLFYKGLTEAMANTHHHAYQGQRGDGLEDLHRWWMFSQLKDGELTVAICDLGIGIPRSLRENRAGLVGDLLALVAKAVKSENDAETIEAAMELGKTRTSQAFRGKGLHDIRTVLDALGGRLQIHSNRGFYVYEAETKRGTCKNFKDSILGTILLWQVPIPKASS